MFLLLFTGHAEELSDIEFTVTTLNCNLTETNEVTEEGPKPISGPKRKVGRLVRFLQNKVPKKFLRESLTTIINDEKCSSTINVLETTSAEAAMKVKKEKKPKKLKNSSKFCFLL